MMKSYRFCLSLFLIGSLLTAAYGQTSRTESFEQIDILVPTNKTLSVKVIFLDDSMQVVNKKGAILKTFKYADLKTAEYSYTESYRWREGLAMTAIGFVVPGLWLVALPLGFTKTKHHWITIQSADDYAVLKINKRIKKLFIPSFEVHTGIKIEAMGNSK